MSQESTSATQPSPSVSPVPVSPCKCRIHAGRRADGNARMPAEAQPALIWGILPFEGVHRATDPSHPDHDRFPAHPCRSLSPSSCICSNA
jgi:hypothetical protein